MYGIEDRAHLEAIARVCYDHVDMLWQDDYFEMWDNHLTPLFESLGDDGEGLPIEEAKRLYQHMSELVYKNADSWFQEDWYEFCGDVFDLLLLLCQRDGTVRALLEQFPYVYSVAE